ncbi:hypothetical protein D9M71_503080 [compost metagenome]
MVAAADHQAAPPLVERSAHLRRHVRLAGSVLGVVALPARAQQQAEGEQIGEIVRRRRRFDAGLEVAVPPLVEVAATGVLDQPGEHVRRLPRRLGVQRRLGCGGEELQLRGQSQPRAVGQVDEAHRRAQPAGRAQRHPLRRELGEGDVAATAQLVFAATDRSVQVHRQRRLRLGVLQRRQQGVEFLRTFDQQGVGGERLDQRAQVAGAARAVVAHRRQPQVRHGRQQVQGLRRLKHPGHRRRSPASPRCRPGAGRRYAGTRRSAGDPRRRP